MSEESFPNDKRFAIIDIETTGLRAGHEKITEIAIILHDGKQIIEEFSSLVNPERKIPYFITQLTGINDQMVSDAPKFYELARNIIELTDNATIVGHNVNFDYSFLKSEFKSLGYDFQRKTMDTIKLSRKLIPGLPSYSLGKLCTSLNIPNKSRHRAAGDAMATTKLFELLFSIDDEPESLSLKGLSSNLNRSVVENLPELSGVYYFFDDRGKMIYVGKSINIKARVMQHLNNNTTKRAIDMKNTISEIEFTLTGSGLIALLLESEEIKKHKPVFNRAQQRSIFTYGLYNFIDDQGYIRLKFSKIIDELMPLYAYSSQVEAREHLLLLTEQFRLCQRLNNLYPGQGACFHYHIKQCNGACVNEEPSDEYNERVLQALERYHFDHENFYVFDAGRNEMELSVIKIENGRYCGFGYLPKEFLVDNPEIADDHIKRFTDNREVRQIIRSYLKKNKVMKIWPVIREK
jgi:DNA polymerase-3 subunit epsilon